MRRKALEHEKASVVPPGILRLLLPPLAIPYILVLLLLLFPVSYSPVLYKGGRRKVVVAVVYDASESVCALPPPLLFRRSFYEPPE